MSKMRFAVAKATFWAALETGGAQLSTFLFFVVFARILTPDEFGVYALALAIVGTVNMVLFQGFGDALIQVETLDEDYTSTVFWTNMMLAVGMIALLQVIALLGPTLFAEPMIRPVIAWLSLLCIPQAMVSVHSALARRALDLRVFAIRTIVGYVVGGAVGLVLALDGWGVWSLVVSQFVQAVVIVLVMWRSSDWRPRWVFSRPAFWELLHFSKHFMAASIIRSCIDDFGSVLIGLSLDVTAVGYYALALRVMRAVITVTMTPLQLVMMPVLSRIADNRVRFGAAYTDMIVMASTVWVPAVAGLGLLAPELVPMVFGAHWEPAVAILQAMCFAAVTMPLWAFSGQALSAIGRPDAFARLAYWQLGLYCLVFPAASHFGVFAVGWAWSALSAVMVPVALATLRQSFGLHVAALLVKTARIALAGAVMAGVLLAAQAVLPGGAWPLAAEVALGALVYAAVLESFCLPGHLARIVVLVRGAMPVLGS
jgi:O-antigen/teichoic acid export membrane protein